MRHSSAYACFYFGLLIMMVLQASLVFLIIIFFHESVLIATLVLGFMSGWLTFMSHKPQVDPPRIFQQSESIKIIEWSIVPGSVLSGVLFGVAFNTPQESVTDILLIVISTATLYFSVGILGSRMGKKYFNH